MKLHIDRQTLINLATDWHKNKQGRTPFELGLAQGIERTLAAMNVSVETVWNSRDKQTIETF